MHYILPIIANTNEVFSYTKVASFLILGKTFFMFHFIPPCMWTTNTKLLIKITSYGVYIMCAYSQLANN